MAYIIDDAPQEAATQGRYVVHDEPDTWQAKLDAKLKTAPQDIAAGLIKGASNIGATIISPLDKFGLTGMTSDERRRKVTESLQDTMGADPNSLAFKGGELGSEIAGTAGAGPLIASGIRAAPIIARAAPRLATAIETGGFKLGGPAATTVGQKAADLGIRTAGGAIAGGASAGLVDPSNAPAGMAIGGALPGAVKVAGEAGKALASEISPEVQKLYQRAKQLGIDIPADRLTNSKPLNAAAASLNYVPFSGRAATEEQMGSQVNRALSRTFGQDTQNLADAVKKAKQSLGDKFEMTLKSNNVNVDNQFINDMTANLGKAQLELGDKDAKIIANMIDEIKSKAGSGGVIDGQSAYNIKKTLDRIGARNSNEAFYARELKDSLMDALDRSLGPKQADQFKLLRKAYGNMLEVEPMVANGADAGVSMGKLANVDTKSPEIQELADIAAQFAKTRENPHGAAQRVVLGTAATLGSAGAAIPVARVANSALNSETVKKLLLRDPVMAAKAQQVGSSKTLRALLYNGPTRSNP